MGNDGQKYVDKPMVAMMTNDTTLNVFTKPSTWRDLTKCDAACRSLVDPSSPATVQGNIQILGFHMQQHIDGCPFAGQDGVESLIDS